MKLSRVAILTVWCCLVSASVSNAVDSRHTKPNIVLVMADDLGWSLHAN